MSPLSSEKSDVTEWLYVISVTLDHNALSNKVNVTHIIQQGNLVMQLRFILESKNISIRMLKDVQMTVPKVEKQVQYICSKMGWCQYIYIK